MCSRDFNFTVRAFHGRLPERLLENLFNRERTPRDSQRSGIGYGLLGLSGEDPQSEATVLS